MTLVFPSFWILDLASWRALDGIKVDMLELGSGNGAVLSSVAMPHMIKCFTHTSPVHLLATHALTSCDLMH